MTRTLAASVLVQEGQRWAILSADKSTVLREVYVVGKQGDGMVALRNAATNRLSVKRERVLVSRGRLLSGPMGINAAFGRMADLLKRTGSEGAEEIVRVVERHLREAMLAEVQAACPHEEWDAQTRRCTDCRIDESKAYQMEAAEREREAEGR